MFRSGGPAAVVLRAPHRDRRRRLIPVRPKSSNRSSETNDRTIKLQKKCKFLSEALSFD